MSILKGNTIKDVIQGIHIGTSDNKSKDQGILKAGTVLISGNSLECIISAAYLRERHGIFIGNCDSLVLNENYIKLNPPPPNPKIFLPPMNGIRIYGHFGKRLIIKDNHLEGFGYGVEKVDRKKLKINYGIFIHYLNSVMTPRWWILEANVTENIRIEGVGRIFRTPKMIFADRWRVLKHRQIGVKFFRTEGLK